MNHADIALEARVIGAVLTNPSFYNQASFLGIDAFSEPAHANTWRAIEANVRSSKSISPSSVAIHNSGIMDVHGGMDFLAGLASMGDAVSTNFLEAADHLHQLAQWRRIATISARLSAACTSREKTPDEILSGLASVASKTLAGGRDTSMSKREVAERALKRATTPRPIITTGIDSLDFLMQGGLQPGRLYGIGAPYGRGKTILLGTISENLNLQQVPHAFISMETDPEDIEIRSCARHLGLNAASIFDQQDPDHATFVASVSSYIPAIPDNVFYEYLPGASMDEIHRTILRAKSRHGIQGVMVDYWQLIRGRERGQNEEAHLRNCADRLAAICRTLNIWCIITAQVDDHGRLRTSDALLMSAALYIQLCRDENDTGAYFVTKKSNYTRYADTGSESVPGMIFDMAGPHFRNTEPEDIPALASESDSLGV
jgi:replicative DNA helicase